MIDAVFISDLHLHPNDDAIQARFNAFIAWAAKHVRKVYILGDFFHVWAGDDSLDSWSDGIAVQLSSLAQQGIRIFYMHGNRDFLLGRRFAKRAGWTILPQPSVIQLGSENVLLVHGDQYCTKDKSHQRFRLITKNKLCQMIFLSFPLSFRNKIVNKVRGISIGNKTKALDVMDVVPDTVTEQMNKHQVNTLIHGHTHKPGLNLHHHQGRELQRFVLSDWDDTPWLLCYDNTKGFCFDQNWCSGVI